MNHAWSLVPSAIRQRVYDRFREGPVLLGPCGVVVDDDQGAYVCPFGLALALLDPPDRVARGAPAPPLTPSPTVVADRIADGDVGAYVAARDFIGTYSDPLDPAKAHLALPLSATGVLELPPAVDGRHRFLANLAAELGVEP
jgi:hypothetical protein